MYKRCSLRAASAVYSNCPTSGPDLHDAGRMILGMAASHSIPWVGSCQNSKVSTSRVAASPSAAAPRIVAQARVTDHLPAPNYIGGMKPRRYNRYHEPHRYGAAGPPRDRRLSSVGGYVVAAFLIGVTAGTGCSVTTPYGQQALMPNASYVAVSMGACACAYLRWAIAGVAAMMRALQGRRQSIAGNRAIAKAWTATTMESPASPNC